MSATSAMTSVSLTLDTFSYVQELKAMLSREQGRVVRLDEVVRTAMREALDRRRENPSQADGEA